MNVRQCTRIAPFIAELTRVVSGAETPNKFVSWFLTRILTLDLSTVQHANEYAVSMHDISKSLSDVIGPDEVK